MTYTALGSKRKCLACGTLFFDLHRDPILCPKCGEVFIPQPLPHSPTYRPKTRIPSPPDAVSEGGAPADAASEGGAPADAASEGEEVSSPESDAESGSEDALQLGEADTRAESEPNLLDPELDADHA